MTGTQTLLARGTLGVFATVIGSVALSIRRFQTAPAKVFDRCAMLAFAASRLSLFCLTYFVLHIPPRGDIPAYYFPEATAVSRGLLPYRDFPSSYAPLHPYIDALVLVPWKSPVAIILFAILAEGLLLCVWLLFARTSFGEQCTRTAVILYLASPISLQFVAVDGQDNVIIALMLALATLLLYRKREAASGILAGLAIVLVKFLPLLYLPALLAAARYRLRWMIGCTGILLAGYGTFAWMRLPLLYPIYVEGQMKSAGDLPYLIESILGAVPDRLWNGLLLFAILLVSALIVGALRGVDQPSRMRILTFGAAALTLTLVLFAKKSWPAYLMLALFPICLTWAEGKNSKLRVALFSLFSIVAVVEHSYWASILDTAPAAVIHAAMVACQPKALLYLLLQLSLLAGYIWLLLEALHQILATKQGSNHHSSHLPVGLR